MKVVTIIGARPQFVKAAMVSHEFSRRSGFEEVIVHTGQHFDKNMSDVFFDEMCIPRPNYHLNINSVGHGAMTGRMLERVEEIICVEQPDCVLVYGDTNSTLAGALAAKKLHVKVVHVEAGLRSFNMKMPEEINRILTDRISDTLCCPTEHAVANLEREGFRGMPVRIERTGDVMQDAANFYRELANKNRNTLETLNLKENNYAVCTIHRAENTDSPCRLREIVEALNQITKKTTLILPLHPRTRNLISKHNLALDCIVCDPVGYLDMINLIANSRLVITDSGGLQKEAFFFKKPCVTLRDETEWIELVDGGFNVIAGAEKKRILECFEMMGSATLDFSKDLYGGGMASANIVDLF